MKALRNNSTSKILLYIVKIVVSVLAILFLVKTFGTEETIGQLRKANPFIILLSVLLYLLSQLISTFRLGYFLSIANVNISILANFKLYLIGMAYNLFLPGGIGGDGYKLVIYKSKYKGQTKPVLSALLADRLIGLVAIIFIMSILLPLTEIIDSQLVWVVSGICIALSLTVFNAIFKSFRSIFTKALLVSIAVQLTQISIILILVFGESITKTSFTFLLSSLATAIPIFLGGVGAREIVFGYMSSLFHLDTSLMITGALLFSLVSIISAIPGLILDWRLNKV